MPFDPLRARIAVLHDPIKICFSCGKRRADQIQLNGYPFPAHERHGYASLGSEFLEETATPKKRDRDGLRKVGFSFPADAGWRARACGRARARAARGAAACPCGRVAARCEASAEAGVVGAGAALWLVAVGWEVLELGCGLWGVGPAFGGSPGEQGRTRNGRDADGVCVT